MKRYPLAKAPRFRIHPNGAATLAGISYHALEWILDITRVEVSRCVRRYEKRLATGVNDPQLQGWLDQLVQLEWVLQQLSDSRKAALDADHARHRRPPRELTPVEKRAAWKAELQEKNKDRQFIKSFVDGVLESGFAKYEQEDRDGPSETAT